MTLKLEVKEIHIHVHIHADDSEALREIRNLSHQVDRDTANMKSTVEQSTPQENP